jgi:Uma2 family endonuclease
MLVATNMGICTKVDGKTVIKAPDWFYVPQVSPLQQGEIRRSYTPHTEGELPAIVMEFLSDTDGGEYSYRPLTPYGKMWFYERILKVPLYIVFDPVQPLLEVRQLNQDGRYELLKANNQGRYFVACLNLYLGIWQGKRQEQSTHWLRWWDSQGNLLLWGSEGIAQEKQRAEQEKQRADLLAEKLRTMGINPEEIS